ncbi:septal ring lytic transglycosylase RlpA family protein [Marinomonas colpomeniae]|nr:septal ring lytic transglycosylase RlpA family protein [Marinomonas colpomeniae]
MMKKIATLCWVLLSLTIVACTSGPISRDDAAGFEQNGEASYYADKYQGRKTANGEFFDQKAMTAAHKRLPFGSKVKVTNVENGKSIVVRINDRGPFIRGRIIDLSKSAFQRIGNTNLGIIEVEIEVLH